MDPASAIAGPDRDDEARMASNKLESYLTGIARVAGGPITVREEPARGGAAGGNDPLTHTVWIADDLDPQLRQSVTAHEATHVALYYEGWAFARTPAAGADAQILQGIGALLTNVVQHPEIERRLGAARIDARPGHRANAIRRIAGLSRFTRKATHLENIHEALYQLDLDFLRDEELRRRVEIAFGRAFPEAIYLRNEIRGLLGAGPASAAESLAVARRVIDHLHLSMISAAAAEPTS